MMRYAFDRLGPLTLGTLFDYLESVKTTGTTICIEGRNVSEMNHFGSEKTSENPSKRGNGEASTAGAHAFQVLVFDCDGVLFDSREANTRFYSHILETIGFPAVSPEQQEYIHMHPVVESLHFLLPDETNFQKAWTYTQRIDFKAFNVYLDPEPGLVRLLKSAHRTHRIALATNRTVSTHDVLAHFDLGQFFDLVVSASDVRFPKPHPESMERILAAFSVQPHQVLYVGDSKVDEALALSTGVCFVAYKNSNLQATHHINHFDELYAII
jgi:phosphoglycolate phosphatase